MLLASICLCSHCKNLILATIVNKVSLSPMERKLELTWVYAQTHMFGFCESMGFQRALLNATAVNAISESPSLVYVVVAMAAR